MDKVSRIVAIINNTARVQNISGDQMGVLGSEPFYCVVNPLEVAKAILASLEEAHSVDSTHKP